jgi:hypothetical protein
MIAEQLATNKWNALSNPFGTIYDPISIARCLQNSLVESSTDEHLFLQREDIHSHYFFHSDLAALSKGGLLSQIEAANLKTKEFIETSNWLMVTLGSSIAFQHIASQTVVANCHKMPSAHFIKVQLSENEIVDVWRKLIINLQSINPDLKIVLTVSPVRHTRHGLQENMVSKSILRLACDKLQSEFESVSYFPAYEIMLDELRNYQYYETDQIHPNKEAQDHIWNRFMECYMSEDSLKFIHKWSKLLQSLQHRALLPDSIAHQKFLQNTLQQLLEVASEVDVNQEIKTIKGQINDLNQ